MRFDVGQLKFKALCVLHDAADQSIKGPVPKSLGLRFALAYLFSVSRTGREWFDEFWRTATAPEAQHRHPTALGVERSQSLNAMFNRICREVGMERTGALDAALRAAIRRDR
ncbi:hypothetical protein [Sphingosinicella rhizophila]|uniref:Uncharacterized protein n=1 Tax=Sphingosinicella rhizophila TaxID=3050082 RepID=A0ABU3Q8T2_9SPHN|nr:hypothetical protein [Sphingosinicella sp. GR2756]MDT9599814.1 hypothetical protein [Sphingosinicella sp. GR2756]